MNQYGDYITHEDPLPEFVAYVLCRDQARALARELGLDYLPSPVYILNQPFRLYDPVSDIERWVYTSGWKFTA